MNNLDKQYFELLNHILENGRIKEDRTGTGTKSVFDYTIRHKMSEGAPILTSKKVYFKGVVHELLWFLRGETNIKYLVDNNVNIWNGDCYKRFLKEANKIKEAYLMGDIIGSQPQIDDMFSNPDTLEILSMQEFVDKIKSDDEFAKKWGELGPVYGKQWRGWRGNGRPLTNDYEGNVSSYLVKPIDQISNLIHDLKTNPDSRRLMVSAWNVGDLPVIDYRTDDELYQDYLKKNS